MSVAESLSIVRNLLILQAYLLSKIQPIRG
jgi:hypothetical protein